MLNRGASGREIILQAGDYEARIVTVGAGLAGADMSSWCPTP